MKCNRRVGTVLANGNLEFLNTRLLSFETIQHNFDSRSGREVKFQRVSEKRSLCGQYEASKRISVDHQFEEFEPPTKRIHQEFQCFQAQVYPECEICAIANDISENVPIIPEDEEDQDDISLHNELSEYLLFPPAGDEWINYDSIIHRSNSPLNDNNRSSNDGTSPRDNDAFFNQDTVPFPFNMMPANVSDVILPDYESVSEIEFFTRPLYSPPNVYHFTDDDHYHYVPPLRADTFDENEPYSPISIGDYHEMESVYNHVPNSLSSDNLSDLDLPVADLDPEFIEFCMQNFSNLASMIVIAPFLVDEDEIQN